MTQAYPQGMKALFILIAALPAAAAAPRVLLPVPRAAPLWSAAPGPAALAPAALGPLALTPAVLAPVVRAPAAAPAPRPAADHLRAMALPAASASSPFDAGFDGAAAKAPVDGPAGPLMASAIDSTRGAAVGSLQPLSFRPSLGSLRRMAKLEGFEVMLARRRGEGWVLIKGDVGSVPVPAGDFDAYYHNHYYHPILAKSFTPYPSDTDLIFSAGKDARFYVVSESGVVEWSPRVPYYPYSRGRLSPEKRARLLEPSRDEDHGWARRFRRGNLARGALNWILPTFYAGLLAASGIAFRLYRWKDPALTQDFIER